MISMECEADAIAKSRYPTLKAGLFSNHPSGMKINSWWHWTTCLRYFPEVFGSTESYRKWFAQAAQV